MLERECAPPPEATRILVQPLPPPLAVVAAAVVVSASVLVVIDVVNWLDSLLFVIVESWLVVVGFVFDIGSLRLAWSPATLAVARVGR